MVDFVERITAETFDEIAANTEKRLEFIGGEIVEVPSNPYSSQIAALIIAALIWYLKNNPIAHVTGEGGGYRVSGERYAPDVAVMLKSRQAQLVREGYNPLAPDLAVEVISPSDKPRKVQIKIANYLAANTLLWVVYPETKEVEVYRPGQAVKILDEHGTLDAGTLLPDFTLAVKDIVPIE